jgi:XTP/dITP diphosphohydrolase
MQLVFATNNQHKVEEIGALLGDEFQLLGLQALHISGEIPEDHETLEENASQKAWFIHNMTGQNCFADDTGLEVDCLGGEPGVYSARYARIGNPVFPDMEPSEGNIRKLLMKMESMKERSARFRTVISLILSGKEYHFQGIAEGRITKTASGSKGFGYDPVFIPAGYETTFAEMDLAMKNQISHRSRAVQQLVDFLKRM